MSESAGHAIEERIASLRRDDAHLVDPIGFYQLENLALRANAYSGRTRSLLDAKILQMALDYQARLPLARSETVRPAKAQLSEVPHDTLRSLVHRLAQHEPYRPPAAWGERVGAPAELKSVKYFRNTWSQLSVDKQVKNAIQQAPQNAGPINSHMVALRSLELMRDISPDYLNRFMTYMDSLMSLDTANKKPRPTRARSQGGKPIAQR
jgi:hypothetical protein